MKIVVCKWGLCNGECSSPDYRCNRCGSINDIYIKRSSLMLKTMLIVTMSLFLLGCPSENDNNAPLFTKEVTVKSVRYVSNGRVTVVESTGAQVQSAPNVNVNTEVDYKGNDYILFCALEVEDEKKNIFLVHTEAFSTSYTLNKCATKLPGDKVVIYRIGNGSSYLMKDN